MRTLPDLLAPGLRVVFVGINPSTFSVERGHYFARKTNRFWPAFSRSRLSSEVRAALGRDPLGPPDDVLLPALGFGFTDVVKVPSSNASALRPSDFAEWAPRLAARLAPHSPRVVCFHGVTAFRPFSTAPRVELGAQEANIAGARVFVVPNPSPANAHFTLEDQVRWYDELDDFSA